MFSILLLMAASGTPNPLGPNTAIGVGCGLCHGSPNKELGFLKLLLLFYQSSGKMYTEACLDTVVGKTIKVFSLV